MHGLYRKNFFMIRPESIWTRYLPLPDSAKPYFYPAVVGTATAVAAPYALCYFLGLSAAGPTAGGLFAAKMGAGVKAGSVMAVTQSVAMGGTGAVTAKIGTGLIASKVVSRYSNDKKEEVEDFDYGDEDFKDDYIPIRMNINPSERFGIEYIRL